MAQKSGLGATFLVHVKARFTSPVVPADLDELLWKTWETARAPWPGVALPAEPFIIHVAERLPETSPPGPLEAILEQLSLPELYLTCACARGLAPALALFERDYLTKLPSLLRGPQMSDALLDEACQLTRVKLLVSTSEGEPRISEYTGRGSLLSWVRVIVVRTALKLQAREKPAPEQDADTVLAALRAPGMDAELELLKRRHRHDFRHAVCEAFAVLTPDERHLFRLHYTDQLSMYELATLFRVNQSTVSRWLKGARLKVHEETQRLLKVRLGLSARDLKSFLAAIDSQLEVGISQLLCEDDSEDGGEPG